MFPLTKSIRAQAILICSLIFCCWESVHAAPPALLIDDFDDEIQNHLGGYRNTFDRAPSTAKAERTDAVRLGDHGRSARLAAHRAPEGFCGYWIHFFDMRAVEKRFLDARPFGVLSFWVRGAKGGEELLVKLADKRWIEKEDSVAVGRVRDFLPGGITQEWREVRIPLNQHSQLDWSLLGGVTFEFDKPGDWEVFIDDVSLQVGERKPGDPAPMPPEALPPKAPVPAAPTADAPVSVGPHPSVPPLPRPDAPSRKLWVWNTHQILRSEEAGLELLDFCRDQRIAEVWMQALYALETEREPAHAELGRPGVVRHIELRQVADLRKFLRTAHARGVKVHALDGFPEFAQREFHKVPMGLVDTIIRFNAEGSADERFDGIHFDNEPYLLLGWHDPVLREEILRDFLELNAECQRRIREQSTMVFGIDIPFWWQERDESTGNVVAEVEFRGKRQAASYHCLEWLDNVGVMNYRDTADGADGMISHGRELLAHADEVQHAVVSMGVETFRYEPTPVWFFFGLPRDKFRQALVGPARDLARLSRLNDIRFRTLDDGELVHLGVELPADANDDAWEAARRTLVELARRMGVKGIANPVDELFEQAVAAQARGVANRLKDPEIRAIVPRPILDAATGQTLAGFQAESIMLGKITFADDPPGQLVKESTAADEYFRRYRQFDGIAFHYYETFREKCQE